jgi:predicted HTH domain antitoxin
MGSTLTTRLPDDLAAEIERISEEEQLDKSAVARRLLDRAVREHRREQAFERYERGEISLGTLAEQADLPLRQVLAELRERGVHFQYSKESLHEDFPDA